MLQTTPRITSPILNDTKHVRASRKYSLVNTNDIIQAFNAHGYYVDEKTESGVRVDHNIGKQKHIVMFRHQDDANVNTGEVFRIFMLNSHNMTTSLMLDVGLYRFVCCNGIVSSDSTHQPMKFRHDRGDLIERIHEAIPQVAARAQALGEWRDAAKSVDLSLVQEYQFANVAARIALRGRDRQINYTGFKQPLRSADVGQDLWTVFNKYQEKVLRGGLQYYVDVKRKDKLGREFVQEEQRTTRAIKDPKRILTVNKQLSNLMDLTLEHVS